VLLKDYRPRSALVIKVTDIQKPSFPVVDCHNHLAEMFGHPWEKKPVSELLDKLDEASIRVYVDLDGGFGEDILRRHLDYFKAAAPDRFVMFGGVDWKAWADKGDKFGEWAASRVREQVAWGAQGIKIWKPFGLTVTDQHNQLVALNDPRLVPLWETAAELDIPIVMHVADPVAFFWPTDEHNERWDELSTFPDWHFPSPPYPSHLSIMEAMARLITRHPKTTFIGAHIGSYAENLGWIGDLLDRYPNFYVDIAARIGELGRQPYSARRFFLRFAERILFGTDMGPSLETYRRYYRFLETDDEYFNYSLEEIPSEGRWYAYGIYLPEEVLAKVYYQNAEKVILNRGQNGNIGTRS